MKIKIPYIIVLVTLLVSCSESFLEETNPNQITTVTFWQTESDLNSAVASIYAGLCADFGPYGPALVEIKEFRTENYYVVPGNPNIDDIQVYQNTASNGYTSGPFENAYKYIFYANQVVENGNEMNIDVDVKNKYVAEAKFLRGIYYFSLVNEFGSVPIRTKLITSTNDYPIKRSPIEEVWQQVISDFTDAAQYLPITRPATETGRATKGAALAFIGRAYLYQGNWEEAKTVLESIVNSESEYGYGLQENFNELFDGKHENGEESLFETQYSLTAVGTNSKTPWLGGNTYTTWLAQDQAPALVGGWEYLYPLKSLLDDYLTEPAANGEVDPRAVATIAWNYPGCMFYQHEFSTVEDWTNKLFTKKYQNWWNADEGDYTSELNEFCMRYADVLLMLAEAYTMQGSVTAAAPLVHRIRERAHLTNKLADLMAYSQEQMMSEIRHQRNLEFAWEGLHFYDMRRWGLLEKAIKDTKKFGYERYSSKYDYFPIPQYELDANPLMTQNDLWE